MATKKPSEYIVFNATGPVEKEIVAVSVVSSLKSKYKDHEIIVVSKTPEVWLHNPDVFRVYGLGNMPYFFEDFIKDKSTKIFWQDPILTNAGVHKRKNLIEIWCDLCKIQWNKKEPQLYFTFREFEATERMMARNLKLNLRQSLCAMTINKNNQEKMGKMVNSTSKKKNENN